MNSTLPTLVVIFPTTAPSAMTCPQHARNWAVVGKDPPPRLSPKQSQNLTSLEKKPNSSDWPSSLLRGSLLTSQDRLARFERVNS
ncbi:hypothetical protein AVEN_162234-1 [Araneus ventricosus]|uniref:Uncharacterized protein n=1 Tax=Araneus ventricosus TaxID=182803 RepID=A0A4Y2EZT8_ARAVE|nr:hypothetical protein AVEN_162234-1 [Araneus ventricosus]